MPQRSVDARAHTGDSCFERTFGVRCLACASIRGASTPEKRGSPNNSRTPGSRGPRTSAQLGSPFVSGAPPAVCARVESAPDSCRCPSALSVESDSAKREERREPATRALFYESDSSHVHLSISQPDLRLQPRYPAGNGAPEMQLSREACGPRQYGRQGRARYQG